jgi:hypothetical protein
VRCRSQRAIRRIGFQKKNGFPVARIIRGARVCASALLNNRYCCNPLGTRCRVSGSNCHACFKESRAFKPRRCQAPLYAVLVPSVCISIIRCNNADCGVAR